MVAADLLALLAAAPPAKQSELPAASPQLWQTFAAGVVGFIVSRLVWDGIERFITGRRLKNALAEEVGTAFPSIERLAADVKETIPHGERILGVARGAEAVAAQAYAELINKLFAGWTLFAPSLDVMKFAERLSRKQSRALVCYADAWARLMEGERRYARWHGELLKIDPPEGAWKPTQQEIVHQVVDHLRHLAETAEQVLDRGRLLKKAIRRT